jgi:hypothetical protein
MLPYELLARIWPRGGVPQIVSMCNAARRGDIPLARWLCNAFEGKQRGVWDAHTEDICALLSHRQTDAHADVDADADADTNSKVARIMMMALHCHSAELVRQLYAAHPAALAEALRARIPFPAAATARLLDLCRPEAPLAHDAAVSAALLHFVDLMCADFCDPTRSSSLTFQILYKDTLVMLVMLASRAPPQRAAVICHAIRCRALPEACNIIMQGAWLADMRPALIAAAEVGNTALVHAVLTAWPLPVPKLDELVHDALKVAELHHGHEDEVVGLLRDVADNFGSAEIVL